MDVYKRCKEDQRRVRELESIEAQRKREEMRDAMYHMRIWNNYNSELIGKISGVDGTTSDTGGRNSSFLSVGRKGDSISEIVRKGRRSMVDLRAFGQKDAGGANKAGTVERQ